MSGKLERRRVSDAAAVEVRRLDATRLGQPGDLRRRPMDEDDADVQRPEQGDIEQQRREVVVRDDAGVNRQDERLVAELRDVMQDAAEVGQLHGCVLREEETDIYVESLLWHFNEGKAHIAVPESRRRGFSGAASDLRGRMGGQAPG